ncbi:unnamed protein product [Heligmosomoides polygyrus]|uniref:Reverse transcriptase domain-containing protein n=1 Tax=Heligmosomoides polygyrus TaxID=6339 RepID=A0A183FPV8_HELPZ|nr:unnamed protein product [Heligmosomoides polygyrus]
MLASEGNGELERKLQAWCDRLEPFGLKLKVKKTEYLTTEVTESSSLKVNGIELSRTAVFKYLGSATASEGKLMAEVNSRVSAGSYLRPGWKGPPPELKSVEGLSLSELTGSDTTVPASDSW